MASLGFGKRSRRGLQLRGQQDLTGMYDEDTYDGDLDAKGWNTAAAAIQDVWLMTQTSIQIVSQSSNFGFFMFSFWLLREWGMYSDHSGGTGGLEITSTPRNSCRNEEDPKSSTVLKTFGKR